MDSWSIFQRLKYISTFSYIIPITLSVNSTSLSRLPVAQCHNSIITWQLHLTRILIEMLPFCSNWMFLSDLKNSHTTLPAWNFVEGTIEKDLQEWVVCDCHRAKALSVIKVRGPEFMNTAARRSPNFCLCFSSPKDISSGSHECRCSSLKAVVKGGLFMMGTTDFGGNSLRALRLRRSEQLRSVVQWSANSVKNQGHRFVYEEQLVCSFAKWFQQDWIVNKDACLCLAVVKPVKNSKSRS